MRRTSSLWLAIALSAGLHILVVLALSWADRNHSTPARGVVDIDFVEPATHAVNGDTASAPKPKVEPVHAARKINEPNAVTTPAPPTASETSSKATNEVTTAPPAGASGSRSRESETAQYIAMITHALERKRIYPPEALAREEEGKVVVGLTVTREGHVTQVTLEQGSPFSRLNQAAIATVNALGQLAPVPDTIDVPLHLHVPLSFRIERR